MYCLLRPCFQMSVRFVTKTKLKYICICIGFVMLLDFFGAFTHFLELEYDTNFVYPYKGDIHEFVNALRHNQKPEMEPINYYNYTFIHSNKQKCVDTAYSTFRIVYIIKSAIEYADRRRAIRNSWGFEKRFFDVPSRTVFLLGIHPNDEELQAKIKIEAAMYKDIIQADFIDSYYNNTIKTMMGFEWLVKYCSNSKFYMFVDDDIYVSVKNVLRFIRNPANYPDYIKEPKKFEAHKREIKESDNEKEELLVKEITAEKNTRVPYTLQGANFVDKSNNEHALKAQSHNDTGTIVSSISDIHDHNVKAYSAELELSRSDVIETNKYNRLNRTRRQVFDFELPEDVRLFAGFVFVSTPHRHKSSKWYVSLSEYPYDQWPPYVTAGAYILSKEALLDMYYTSLYTKHFRFDDIFLGLVAKKANIEPFHCEEFHFYKKDYTKFNYKYVITSHGYDDPNELLYVWNEQKALGNA